MAFTEGDIVDFAECIEVTSFLRFHFLNLVLFLITTIRFGRQSHWSLATPLWSQLYRFIWSLLCLLIVLAVVKGIHWFWFLISLHFRFWWCALPTLQFTSSSRLVESTFLMLFFYSEWVPMLTTLLMLIIDSDWVLMLTMMINLSHNDQPWTVNPKYLHFVGRRDWRLTQREITTRKGWTMF